MSERINQRWVLARRPEGIPTLGTFRLEQLPVPDPQPGEVLVRNVYLGVDPGMRNQLSAQPRGVGEFDPWPLGATVGFATVGVVAASRHEGFAPGDWVSGILQWQDYAVAPGAQLRRIVDHDLPPTAHLGVLGIPGLSAYFGLRELGQPRAGDTVLVTSAAGAVGATAAQLARLQGCRVVGVAGGADKCRWLTETLGIDAAIDYRAEPDLAAAVQRVCPQGVDVLFDNVGNAMLDAVLPLMRVHGRVVLCGQVADYGKAAHEIPGVRHTNRLITHRLTLRGLFVFDFAPRFEAALAELGAHVRRGTLTWRDDIAQGIDQLPQAFADLFTHSTFGRKIVQIAPGMTL